MNIINYYPWTMIYLNLPPSVGIIGNWSQWTEAETNLITKVSRENLNKRMTMVNFILPKMKVPIVGIDGLKSLGEKQNVSQLINYSVPMSPVNETHDFNNFEPMKNMLHLEKIYILSNHPLLNQLKRIYQASQIIIVEPSSGGNFLKQLKHDLLQGNLKNYYQLVGANYTFRGPVVGGAQNGKKIGFPTANLSTKPSLPIRSGVYLVRVSLPNEDHKRWGLGDYRKLLNNSWAFETYILDFDKDIYGWVITVELVAFHRPNVKFKNFEEIKHLIQKDEVELRKVIAKFKEN